MPVVVVEPESDKRQADAHLLVNIPVAADMEEAVRLLAAQEVAEPILLTRANYPDSEAALNYLQQIRLLPFWNLQPILAVGLEEGHFREQMGEYL